MRVAITATLVGLMLALVVGCGSMTAPKDETPSTTTLACIKPVLEPAEGYPWMQTRDNVTIDLGIEPVREQCVYQQNLKEKWELIKVGEEKKYEITLQPYSIKLDPNRAVFRLNVTNNLNHVLRFHGAVPALTVDGRAIPIDDTKQRELLQAVLTPYATLDLTLPGPSFEDMEKASTVTFAIYDVITEVDEANNPTKRTAFEWILAVRPQEVTKTLPIQKREERMLETAAKALPKYVTMNLE